MEAAVITEAFEEGARRMKMVAGWSNAARGVEEGVGEIGGSVSVGWQTGSVHGVLWHLGSVFSTDADKAVKREQIVAALRFLARRGFHKKSQEDYEEIGRRSYHLKDEHGVPVVLMVFFSEGSVCRFEKVGTKEAPVYELRCDGEAFDPAAEATA